GCLPDNHVPFPSIPCPGAGPHLRAAPLLDRRRSAAWKSEAGDDRVVVGRAVGVRAVEAGRVELGVVVEDAGFVRVDGPDGGAGDAPAQLLARPPVVGLA